MSVSDKKNFAVCAHCSTLLSRPTHAFVTCHCRSSCLTYLSGVPWGHYTVHLLPLAYLPFNHQLSWVGAQFPYRHWPAPIASDIYLLPGTESQILVTVCLSTLRSLFSTYLLPSTIPAGLLSSSNPRHLLTLGSYSVTFPVSVPASQSQIKSRAAQLVLVFYLSPPKVSCNCIATTNPSHPRQHVPLLGSQQAQALVGRRT